jgi:hypothetical protein
MRGNIDAELVRRNDLIPNLVATVDEVASFEQETQTRSRKHAADWPRAAADGADAQ